MAAHTAVPGMISREEFTDFCCSPDGAVSVASAEQLPAAISVDVLSAHDLRKADLIGKSDPFVELTWRGDAVGKTRVVKNTLNPTWEGETFKLSVEDVGTDLSLLEGAVLVAKVFDWDRVGKPELLGVAEVPIDAMLARSEAGEKANLILSGVKGKVKGKSRLVLRFARQERVTAKAVSLRVFDDVLDVKGLGTVSSIDILEMLVHPTDAVSELVESSWPLRILLQPRFWHKAFLTTATESPGMMRRVEFQAFCCAADGAISAATSENLPVAIVCSVLRARDLTKADLLGKSDPFVELTWRGATVGKTAVIKSTLNPAWENESFPLPVEDVGTDLSLLEGASLVAKVFDWDLVGKPDLLGTAVVPIDDVMKYGSSRRAAELILAGVKGKKQGKSTLTLSFKRQEPITAKSVSVRSFDLMDGAGTGKLSMKDAVASLDRASKEMKELVNTCWSLRILLRPRFWRRAFLATPTEEPGVVTRLEFRAFCCSSDGAISTATSEQLPSAFRVHVLRARSLAKADTFGKSDPFVELTWRGDIVGKTGVIKSTLHPTWADETFMLPVEDVGTDLSLLEGAVLVAKVFDWDRVGAPDLLGTAEVPVDSILHLGESKEESEIILSDVKGSNAGKSKLVLSFERKERVTVSSVSCRLYDLVDTHGNGQLPTAALVSRLANASRGRRPSVTVSPADVVADKDMIDLVRTCWPLHVLLKPNLWRRAFSEHPKIAEGVVERVEFRDFCCDPNGAVGVAANEMMPAAVTVDVLRASGLLKSAYLQLTWRGQLLGKTDSAKAAPVAEWQGETFTLSLDGTYADLNELDGAALEIKAVHSVLVGSNSVLGYAVISLHDILRCAMGSKVGGASVAGGASGVGGAGGGGTHSYEGDFQLHGVKGKNAGSTRFSLGFGRQERVTARSVSYRAFDLMDARGERELHTQDVISRLENAGDDMKKLVNTCWPLRILLQPKYWQKMFAETPTDIPGVVSRAEFQGFCCSPEGAVCVASSEQLPKAFVVTVLRAHDLNKADLIGKSDPFVELTWRGDAVGKTRVVKNTLNPTWEGETFKLPVEDVGTDLSLLEGAVLEVKVFDWDRVGKPELLGCSTVPIDAVIDHSEAKRAAQFMLSGAKGKNKGKSKVVLHFERHEYTTAKHVAPRVFEHLDTMGEGVLDLHDIVGKLQIPSPDVKDLVNTCWPLHILLRPRYWQKALLSAPTETPGKMHREEFKAFCCSPGGAVRIATVGQLPALVNVHVLRATDLAKADTFGKSDPFVELTWRDATVGKTAVIKSTLHPTWVDETFKLSVEDVGTDLSLLEGAVLVAKVFDWDRVGAPDLLGTAEVPMGLIVQHWNRNGAAGAAGAVAAPEEVEIVLSGVKGKSKGKSKLTVSFTRVENRAPARVCGRLFDIVDEHGEGDLPKQVVIQGFFEGLRDEMVSKRDAREERR